VPSAEFTVELPDNLWVGEISHRHPEAVLRVLSVMPIDRGGFGLLEIETGDAAKIIEEFEGREEVNDVHVLQETDGEAVFQFETTDPPLLLSLQRAQIPIEPPVEIRDGDVHLTISAPHDRISAFADQLDMLGLPFTLDRIYRVREGAQLLTDSQRDLLFKAIDSGYYDTPRTCTLTELADRLDMAPSTVSETLHRAEGGVIKSYAESQADSDFSRDG
jgi:hypothetical protein